MTPPKNPNGTGTLSKAIRETQRLEGSNARATLGSRDFQAGKNVVGWAREAKKKTFLGCWITNGPWLVIFLDF